jgi:hypothetical protein
VPTGCSCFSCQGSVRVSLLGWGRDLGGGLPTGWAGFVDVWVVTLTSSASPFEVFDVSVAAVFEPPDVMSVAVERRNIAAFCDARFAGDQHCKFLEWRGDPFVSTELELRWVGGLDGAVYVSACHCFYGLLRGDGLMRDDV